MEKMIIHPNTTGVFLDCIDCTSSRPIPGQAKTVSQITAPARSPPMRSPITVTVGIIALGTLQDNIPVGDTFGSCRADIVLPNDFQHGGTRHTCHSSHAVEPKGNRRQNNAF